MTDKNILSDEKKEEIIKAAINEYEVHGTRIAMNTVDMTVRSVLQSPEIQQLRKDAELLSIAVQMLADWCVAVKENGTGWDYWDEHYKDAAYRDNPLRSLIDAAMEVKP